MKLTLLDIVQDILNDMDSDEVNSIDDTTESQQIAQIVKSTYFAMMSTRNWPHMKRGISLEAPGTTATPTHMALDSGVKELTFINYNKASLGDTRKKYQSVSWKEPDDFLRLTNQRNSDEANIDVIIDPSGIELLIRNDQAPTYYTSFDDTHVVFDSYDSEVDDTLQESKVQAQGYVFPTWTATDTFIPDLPEEAFILLQEESKSKASLKLRQIQDVKAEQEAGRQNRWLSRKDWRVHGGVKYPDYGRNGGKGRRDPTFKDS
jgi:hypothetical protein